MYPEVFWKIVDKGGHHQYMFNAMHLNNGNGTFSDIAQLAGISSTDWSWANLIADFDNDGHKDIFVTNGLLRDIRNTDADKKFAQYVQETVDDFLVNNPNAGDVQLLDILNLEEALNIMPTVPLKNFAFKNNGDLTFTKVSDEWGFDQKTFSNGTAYADLDNDGDLDLVVNNINATASVYENKANSQSGNNYLRVVLKDGETNRPICGTKVKVNLNGETQYFEVANVRGMYSTSENIIHIGLGKATMVDVLEIEWPNGDFTSMENLKVNRTITIERAKTKSKKINYPTKKQLFKTVDQLKGLAFQHQENEFDDYKKQVLLPHKMSQFGPAMAVGDINGDGLEDLLMGGAAGFESVLFIQNKNNSFTRKTLPSLSDDAVYEDVDAAFFDADNDGDLDLYIVSGGNHKQQQNKLYQDRLYLNDGKGGFTKTTDMLPRFRDSGAFVRPFDFDQDGDLDLLIGGRHIPWSYPSPAISRLLQNEGGSFNDVTKTLAPDLIFLGMTTDAVWTDFDQDGDQDFIIVGEWMPITFFENKNNTFQKQSNTIANSEGWWYSIEKADVDGDGDDDYLVGNLGMNYKYKATVSEPFQVHYEDFDENGSKDIVLSYYNFGECYPLRGRSCSSEQVPMLQDKFPSYEEFAAADLLSVYPTEKLDQALQYSAKTFASVYIKNNGPRGFKMSPLPNQAQVSSINDFLIEDFDGDGHLDVLLAGNLFPAEIETPRNDAGIGLLLKGNGKGNWIALPANQSGVSLPYDVKRIRALKRGNEVLYLFGCNDSMLLALERMNEE